MSKKILVLATYDSFLKSGFLIANQIEGADIDIIIHTPAHKKNYISVNQLNELGLGNANISYIRIDDDINKNLYLKYDVIILSIGNGLLQRFFKLLFNTPNRSNSSLPQLPLLISVFPGVIFGDDDSILSRMMSDIVLYLCEYDYKRGEELKKKHGFQCTNMLYGFLKLDGERPQEEYKKKVYFIDQVKIPEKKSERIFLLERLISLAHNNPREQFIILPRVVAEDNTVHKDLYPYAELMNDLYIPKNLSIKRVSLSEAFKEMKLCISMSSTVVFEAITNNVPIFIISDLGVRKEFSNLVFSDSGVMGLLSDLDINNPPRVKREWLEEYYYYSSQSSIILNKEIDKRGSCRSNQYQLYKRYENIVRKMKPKGYFFKRKLMKLLRHPILFIKDSYLFRYFKRYF